MAHLEEEEADNGKDPGSDDPGGIEGVTEFMVQLAREVKDTQADEKCCYHCSSPKHFICNCLLMKTSRDEKVKWEGGDDIDEGSLDPSDNNKCHEEPPEGGSQGAKTTLQTPFLNPDPFQQWYRIKNVARVKINGESCMALLDNGAQVNTIMPKYVTSHSLQVGPITDLMGSKVPCMGLGNAYIRPLGYVVIQVQVDGGQGYDEDQIALVIPDLSNFAAQIPVILRTPTIGQVVNMMKGAEMDALMMPWANARVAHLLLVCRMMPIEVGDGQKEKVDANGYDHLMYTQNAETIEPFCSCIILVKAGRAYVGECINIMVQALQTEDGSLLQGFTVQNMYTELRKGSKKAVMMVRNNTAYFQTLQKKTPVARVVAALPVPKPPEGEQLLEGTDESHDSHTSRLTVRQTHGKMFNELDLSSLDSSTSQLVDATHQLLAKYHDIFSLDPTELGCTHSMEHTIKVTDDTPFKQQFR